MINPRQVIISYDLRTICSIMADNDDNSEDEYSLKSHGTLHSSYASVQSNAENSNPESSNAESDNSVVYVGSQFPASLSAASSNSMPIMVAPRNNSMRSFSHVAAPLHVSRSSTSAPTIPLFPIFHPDSAA